MTRPRWRGIRRRPLTSSAANIAGMMWWRERWICIEVKLVMTTKRIDWVDTVKFICIIFVMLSHLETCTGFWSAFYTPFFLTAFFFVSGYVYKPRAKFSELLYKKFRQLFVPWLIFSVFNLMLSQVLSFNEHKSLLNELVWNFLQIRGKGDGIWFVACLFVAFIPFYFFVKLYEKSNGGV